MTQHFYDNTQEHSSCGVGFITNKSSKQTYELLKLSHRALCEIPHRGGMSAEGIGDGAGVNIDLSVNFYRYLTGSDDLQAGEFGVANFFYPLTKGSASIVDELIEQHLHENQIDVILWRDIPTNLTVVNEAARNVHPPLKQVVFSKPKGIDSWDEFEKLVNQILTSIEKHAFSEERYLGLYPLSMSSRTQVYKSRLNSWEVIPFFEDLSHPEHHISSLFFHTRFSTNTAPNPMFAQPFRRMAHNGELNTDRKNRLSEDAIARQNGERVLFPEGQSDSSRLDQTLARRINEDHLEIDTAILAMMPPAWENDESISQPVRDMLEYFSLYEEKNDGPAALIFSDGNKIGARLDRLGLRPLRTEETEEYLTVASESGQFNFPPEDVIRRGRIEAGGMILFNHETQELLETDEILERMAKEKDYKSLLEKARITLADLPEVALDKFKDNSSLTFPTRHVGYSMNQESFKFMLDPMLQTGAEKIFAMGYGLAPNALAADEGGMSRYFSQRFAQVTNPPLDSIREADGMTLRVSLGGKPYFSDSGYPQLTLESPILQPQQFMQIEAAGSDDKLCVATVETLYAYDRRNAGNNQQNIEDALSNICDQVEELASSKTDIIILSDQNLATELAALPAVLTIAAVNQRLIKTGLRFNSSLIYATGQVCSTHDIAVLLGFGASAIFPLTVYHRAQELFDSVVDVTKAISSFQKAVTKALMKTMGKFGLCTVESYIGGEFFEANFINTNDPKLNAIFPNIHSPIGGAEFSDISQSSAHWHKEMLKVSDTQEVPLLGLFKERTDGSGHTFGNLAIRVYGEMTDEKIAFEDENAPEESLSFLPDDPNYRQSSFEVRTPEQIDAHEITSAYLNFSESLYHERKLRPAAIRDVFGLPVNLIDCENSDEFIQALSSFHLQANQHYAVQGLSVSQHKKGNWLLSLNKGSHDKHQALSTALQNIFTEQLIEKEITDLVLTIQATAALEKFLKYFVAAPAPLNLSEVQAAHEITAAMATGAMSHGALIAEAHEAVAMGTNMVGAMSNSGEGGENSSRYNSIRSSKIKQFASGRFGIWTGYLADPMLEEIEIKIAQGAKPGEGGQLPSQKVTIEIAAARGGTPGVELVSPPPHHDTYSIEDLGQLIHDAKAARVKVVVKLVSSEGIGTIAVGVAKAGADLINIAGGTGGTGAAQVTSLKHTGRAAEIGIAEVHQALSENGLRDKVKLRCSNAHQTGRDLIVSAMLGGDSFEFGTTALMMLRCVMAKNCHIKCPAGLTTEHEEYSGDARALAQYYINLAHEVRQILAQIGIKSLLEIRGRSDLLHLINHENIVGQLNMSSMLQAVDQIKINNPVYLESNFVADDDFFKSFMEQFWNISPDKNHVEIDGGELGNRNKTTGGQFSIDIERFLNYQLSLEEAQSHSAIQIQENGRRILADSTVVIKTQNCAGQSFGAFNNSGITMIHSGTCNDGVGKAMSGGRLVVRCRGGGSPTDNGNVLIGNFALFGATGGQLYVGGQVGDRFGVRNSGAVAVVEGAGDFCAEYMTNGSIINLGGYGKGFGNGMSGGTAYQYDPSHKFEQLCSYDSVTALSLDDDSDFIVGQRQALKWHLEQHILYTDSQKAADILANWEQEYRRFYVVIPNALYACHCSDQIKKSMQRKQMLEELSAAISLQNLKQLQHAYQTNNPLFKGAVPAYGDCDSELICAYITSTGLLHRAMELALKINSPEPHRYAKNLIVTLDRKLTVQINKDVKEALSDYADEMLAVLLADKRLDDYKQALALREVTDTPAFGTSVWIIERDKINKLALHKDDSLLLKLATYYSKTLSHFMAAEAT